MVVKDPKIEVVIVLCCNVNVVGRTTVDGGRVISEVKIKGGWVTVVTIPGSDFIMVLAGRINVEVM